MFPIPALTLPEEVDHEHGPRGFVLKHLVNANPLNTGLNRADLLKRDQAEGVHGGEEVIHVLQTLEGQLREAGERSFIGVGDST